MTRNHSHSPAFTSLGILISGRGSNMEAIIRRLKGKVRLVISNNPQAEGMEKAKSLGVTVQVVNHNHFPSRAEFESALVQELKTAEVDLVCLAGFMRLLTMEFLSNFPTVNIHPSLLPKFKGNWRIHERVLKSGQKESGCTVHQVTEMMDDETAVLAQKKVPVLANDTPETLATRILEAEHETYPNVIEKILEGEITLKSLPG